MFVASMMNFMSQAETRFENSKLVTQTRAQGDGITGFFYLLGTCSDASLHRVAITIPWQERCGEAR